MLIKSSINKIYNIKLSIENLVLFSFIILIFFTLFGTDLPFKGKSYEEIFEQETSNINNQIVYSFLFILSLVPLIKKYNKILSFLIKEKFLTLFILLCILSAAWSDYSLISLKRSFQLFVTFLVIVNSVLFLDINVLLKPLKIIVPLYLFTNLFSCLIIPQAVDKAGSWMGIHGHKNGLAQGTYFVFLVSTLYFEKGLNPIKKIYKYLIYTICFLLIVKAQSSTVIIVLTLTLGYWLIKRIEKIFEELKVGRFIIAFFLLFLFFSLSIILYYSSNLIALLPQLFGKDLSISGRGPIWAFIISEIEKRPVLGYGFSTYWIMGGSVVDIFASEFGGFKINQAHNGYLEILLQLGIIGFFFFFVLTIVFLYRIIKIKNDLSIVILLSLLIINYTESILFQPKGISTIIFILTYLLVTKNSLAAKLSYNNIN